MSFTRQIGRRPPVAERSAFFVDEPPRIGDDAEERPHNNEEKERLMRGQIVRAGGAAASVAAAATALAGPPQSLFDTGEPVLVNFDSSGNGNYTPTLLGWSSGHVSGALTERWTAQPFTLWSS